MFSIPSCSSSSTFLSLIERLIRRLSDYFYLMTALLTCVMHLIVKYFIDFPPFTCHKLYFHSYCISVTWKWWIINEQSCSHRMKASGRIYKNNFHFPNRPHAIAYWQENSDRFLTGCDYYFYGTNCGKTTEILWLSWRMQFLLLSRF